MAAELQPVRALQYDSLQIPRNDESMLPARCMLAEKCATVANQHLTEFLINMDREERVTLDEESRFFIQYERYSLYAFLFSVFSLGFLTYKTFNDDNRLQNAPLAEEGKYAKMAGAGATIGLSINKILEREARHVLSARVNRLQIKIRAITTEIARTQSADEIETLTRVKEFFERNYAVYSRL